MVSGHQLVEIHRLHLGRRHLGEIAEPADDLFQFGQFRQQRGGAFAENFVELLGVALARPLHVFDRDLQREQRVLQLVRQPPRQLAPRRHALRLHQALALLHQLVRHAVESARQLPDLVAAGDFHGGAPVAGGHPARAFRQPLHRPRDARRGPPAQHDRHRMPVTATTTAVRSRNCLQLHQLAAGAADQQHAQQIVFDRRSAAARERLRRRAFAQRRRRLAPLAFDPFDQRLKRAPHRSLVRRRPKQLGGRNCGSRLRYSSTRIPAGSTSPERNSWSSCWPPATYRLAAARVHRSHRHQRQRDAVRQLFALQERRARFPVRGRRQPILLIAEARRPLRGRNDGAIARHQLQQPQPVRGRQWRTPRCTKAESSGEIAMSTAASEARCPSRRAQSPARAGRIRC